MTNETNNAPRVTLSPEQLAARDAALKAATEKPAGDKPVVPPVTVEHKPPVIETLKASITSAAETAPSKPADTPKPASPATASPAAKPTSAVATGKAGVTSGDRGAPTTAASKLASDHNAAIAKANANVGKPAQGGTVKTKPATKPAVNVAAAKPVKLGKAATALANPTYVAGYNLARWPVVNSPVDNKPVPAPSLTDIVAAHALDPTGPAPTANRLALAFYLSSHNARLNLYEASMLGGKHVLGLSGDHKMNVANKVAGDGLVTIDKTLHLSWSTGGTAKVVYQVKPTAKGLALITKAFDAYNVGKPASQRLTVPKRWLPEPVKAGNGNGNGKVKA